MPQVSGSAAPGDAALVTLQEIASRTRRSLGTVRNWSQAPAFPAPARRGAGGQPALYWTADITVWLDAMTAGETHPSARSRPARIPPSVAAAIVADYRRGLSQRAVAARNKVTRVTVSRALTRAGVPVRGQSAAQLARWEQEDRAYRRYPEPAQERLPRQQVVERYLAGEDSEALGREYGVAGETILRTVRRAGHATRSRGDANRARAAAAGVRTSAEPKAVPARWDQMTAPERRAMVVPRYERGESTAQIGRALRIGSETVRKVLLDAGVTLRRGAGRPQGIPVLAAEEIQARYARGESIAALAASYRTTRYQVERALAGTPRRGFSAAGRARKPPAPADTSPALTS